MTTTPTPRHPFGAASAGGLLAESGKSLPPRAPEPALPPAPHPGLRARLRFRSGHRAQLTIPPRKPGEPVGLLVPMESGFRMPPDARTADEVLAAYVADLSTRYGLLVELVFDHEPTRDELLTENASLRHELAKLTGRG